MAFVWKSVLLVICSVILIRISGRKSISQMTVASTVILFSLGEILVQPIVNQQIGITLLTVAAFLGTLALLEYLQLKFKLLEKWFSGEAVALIENGRILPERLRAGPGSRSGIWKKGFARWESSTCPMSKRRRWNPTDRSDMSFTRMPSPSR
ncbi:hypothetical protein LJK87_48590 [Paenibacillus sp. P25]|nr:hypothetical protein LJK87_48590 [Paenibacillus sp. P25]